MFGSVQANTDEQRTYYYLTDDARATFDDNEMFAPEPLRELFNRIDHSDRFRELAGCLSRDRARRLLTPVSN